MLPRAAYGLIIAALWIAWIVYWVIAARDSKPVKKVESPASRLGYNIPVWIGAWLMLGAGLRTGWLAEPFITGPTARLVAYWAGVALLAAGLGFTVWARRALGGNWSVSAQQKESHELIQTGPYAITRHPIYTGIIVGLLGSAIAIHQWRALVALALMILGMAFKARIEERFMTELFPEAYPAYRARVKALIPGVY
jgi:protein-S-isoprenylcysteine O-methyltransferase Ste14